MKPIGLIANASCGHSRKVVVLGRRKRHWLLLSMNVVGYVSGTKIDVKYGSQTPSTLRSKGVINPRNLLTLDASTLRICRNLPNKSDGLGGFIHTSHRLSMYDRPLSA